MAKRRRGSFSSSGGRVQNNRTPEDREAEKRQEEANTRRREEADRMAEHRENARFNRDMALPADIRQRADRFLGVPNVGGPLDGSGYTTHGVVNQPLDFNYVSKKISDTTLAYLSNAGVRPQLNESGMITDFEAWTRAFNEAHSTLEKQLSTAMRLGKTVEAEALKGSLSGLKFAGREVVGLEEFQNAISDQLQRSDPSRHILSFTNMMTTRGGARGTLRYNYTEEEMDVQSRLSMLRAGRKIGEEMSPEQREYLTNFRTQIIGEMEGLSQRFEEAEDADERQRIRYEMDAKSSILTQMDTILKTNNQETKSGMEKVADVITRMAGVLSVGALASKFLLQDPFRYETSVATGVIGRQGEVGAVLGAGLQDAAQYELGLNQMFFNSGLSLAGAGFSGMFNRGAGGGGGRGAIAGLIGGGALAALGVTGWGTDILEAMGLAQGKDDIVAVNFAQQLLDPSRTLSHWDSSRAGLMGSGAPGFGYYYGPDATAALTGYQPGSPFLKTGNTVIDEILENNPHLSAMGYSGEDIGSLLSQSTLSLTGRRDSLRHLAGEIGTIAGAFGIDESTVLGMLQSAQTLGTASESRSVRRAIGAGADASGDISSFTVEVISKALMETASALKLQNIARNSDELEKEVFAFRQVVARSGTPLGEMIQSNPEVFSQLMMTFDSAIKRSLTDPSGMALDVSLGSSIYDLATGSPEVMMRRLRFQANQMIAAGVDMTDFESMMQTVAGRGSLSRDISGLGDWQLTASLLSLVAQGHTLDSPEIQALLDDGADSAIEGRTEDIVQSPQGQLIQSMTDQANAMMLATQTVTDKTLEVNNLLVGYLSSSTMIDDVNEKINEIVGKIEDLLGVGDSPATAMFKQDSETFSSYVSQQLQTDPNLSDWELANNYMLMNPSTNPDIIRNYFGGELPLPPTRSPWNPGDGGLESGGQERSYEMSNSVRNLHETVGLRGSSSDLYNRGLSPRVLDSTINHGGEGVELRMRLSGVSPDKIKEIATQAAEEYAAQHRLNYI